MENTLFDLSKLRNLFMRISINNSVVWLRFRFKNTCVYNALTKKLNEIKISRTHTQKVAKGPPNEIYDKNFYTKRMFCHVAIHCPCVATVTQFVQLANSPTAAQLSICPSAASVFVHDSNTHTHTSQPTSLSHPVTAAAANWLFVHFASLPFFLCANVFRNFWCIFIFYFY